MPCYGQILWRTHAKVHSGDLERLAEVIAKLGEDAERQGRPEGF
jgi:hypothetical protein